MHPGVHAAERPDAAAVIEADTGAVLTWRQLDERSNRLAQLLYARGLRRGDHIALLMENHLRYSEVVWAALRSGLYITAINRYLTAGEAAYIVNDSGAKALVTSLARAEVAAALGEAIPGCAIRLMIDGAIAGWERYEAAIAAHPATPLAKPWSGDTMLYSSGTTGRPKGIKRALADLPIDRHFRAIDTYQGYGFHPGMVYLSPAPLYHAAPLAYTIATQRFGGTVVMMRHFDAVEALRLIERHRVTHSQWVPTMFRRILTLPPEHRAGGDLSTHRFAIHAAAPCPRDLKLAMFDLWGPIIHEYYGGTEGVGTTHCGPQEWLSHPGSVGRAVMGELHIVDERGVDVAVGTEGLVCFCNGPSFEYHRDPEATAAAHLRPGLATMGDIGRIDDEGFLYLTDRASHMIISGGVNIYPQACEDLLQSHPAVEDAAVIGVPNVEFGEGVLAVVQTADGVAGTDELAAELIAYCRARLSPIASPRRVEFRPQLPREPTGKLRKRTLRDEYWGDRANRLA